MLNIIKKYKKELGNNLVLKSVSSIKDVDRVAEFNFKIHEEEKIDSLVKELLLNHPNVNPDNWYYVEDKKNKKIVSSVCLIKWNLLYDNIKLKSAEMGFVGTEEKYRKKGLFNILAETFSDTIKAENYDISQIQGIPFFYRKYGYNYAIPLIRNICIKPDKIKAFSAGNYKFMKAGLQDIPQLKNLYNTDKLCIKTIRTEKIWKYLLKYASNTATAAETWVILNKKKEITGYFRLSVLNEWGNNLFVSEVSRLTKKQANEVLVKLGSLCSEYSKPYIRLDLPESTELVKAAKSLGAVEKREWAWQMKIVSIPVFLKKIKPVLNKRIAGSRYKSITKKIGINLYKEQYELCFVNGELKTIRNSISSKTKSLDISEDNAVQLLLGYRNIDELMNITFDVTADKAIKSFLNALFPKKKSFLYTIY